MQLDEVERFALSQLFNAHGASEEAMQAFDYQVEARSVTAAGFFSILKCVQPSRLPPPEQEVCAAFSHPRLKAGGMFVCWIEPDWTLCLEGVASNRDWPAELMPVALQGAARSVR